MDLNDYNNPNKTLNGLTIGTATPLEKIHNYSKVSEVNKNFTLLDGRLSKLEKNTYQGSIKVSSSELVTLLNNIAQLFYEKDKQIAELKSTQCTECIKGE